MIWLRDDMVDLLGGNRRVEDFLEMAGTMVKQSPRRCVQRLQLEGQEFYIKQHHGAGWREIFKNLSQGRLPVVSARNEWRAIRAFQQIGLPTPAAAAFGEQGWNPAARRSFILTDALRGTIDLEAWLASQLDQPAVRVQVIEDVACLLRRMHDHGLNHRDFYLCHLRLAVTGGAPALYVMDLHRVQRRRRVPRRWQVKDLAALLYSVLALSSRRCLSSRDCLRFMQSYSGLHWRECLHGQARLWRSVLRRALATYWRHHGELPAMASALMPAMGVCGDAAPAVLSDQTTGTHHVVYAAAGMRKELIKLLHNPESAMAADNARVLKRGRASRVVAVALAGRDLVIKHFPVRGALDRVLGNLRGSRARRSWRNACALMRAGIATPMPLAVVEKRKALWRLDSYLIMEYVPGIRGRELFDSEEIAEHEKQLALQRIVQLFGKLARARISHGDMKDTNIIFSNGQTHLLDLDALRRMRGARLRRALGRDIRRWLKNWNHQPELQRLFRQTLAERGTLSSVKGIEA